MHEGCFAGRLNLFERCARCISVVHQGQFWANTEQMGYIIEALTSTPSSRLVGAKGENLFTPREEQVANLVAEGIGNREIARQLGIKENTVKKSLLRIYDKLGVSNRVELVLYALTHRGLPAKGSQSIMPGMAPACLDTNQVNLLGADCNCLPEKL